MICPACGATVAEAQSLPDTIVEVWNHPKDKIELSMRNTIAAYLGLPEMKAPKPR